jgi:hypothetical protein
MPRTNSFVCLRFFLSLELSGSEAVPGKVLERMSQCEADMTDGRSDKDLSCIV